MGDSSELDEDALAAELSNSASFGGGGKKPSGPPAPPPPRMPAAPPAAEKSALTTSVSGEGSGLFSGLSTPRTSRPGTAAGGAPRPPLPAGAAPPPQPPLGRTPPSNSGRPVSAAGASSLSNDDSYADLLGDSSSVKSLPRGGAPTAAAATAGPNTRSPLAASSRPSSASTSQPPPPMLQPHASGSVTPRSGAPTTLTGMYSPASSMRGSGGGGGGGGGGGTPRPELTRSPAASHGGSPAERAPKRWATTLGDIPTPFDLFRMYDHDNNGCVTRVEFIHMMRDLDGLPLHYAPDEDPEDHVARLTAKISQREARLERLKSRLDALQMQLSSQSPLTSSSDGEGDKAKGAAKKGKGDKKVYEPEAVAELRTEVTTLEERLGKQRKALEEQQREAAKLTSEATPEADRVTPAVRARRAQWRKFVEKEFERADVGANSILSIDEFYMYYYGKLCFRFPVMRSGMNPGALLFNIFIKYCSDGRGSGETRRYEDMLSHQWSKLCRDAKLVNGKTLTRAMVDIIYHRARAADESLETYAHKAGVAATARMYYPQFLFGLDKVAEKRRSGFQEVIACVLTAINTLPEASFADFVVLSAAELEPGSAVPEFLLRPPQLPTNKHSMDTSLLKKMQEESRLALSLTLGLAAQERASQPQHDMHAFIAAKRAAGARSDEHPGPDQHHQHDHGAGSPGSHTPAHSHAHAHALRRTDSAASSASSLSSSSSPHGPPASPHRGGGGAVQRSMYDGMPRPKHDHEVLRRREWERPEDPGLADSRRAARASGVHVLHWPETLQRVRQLDPDSLMMGLKRAFEAYAAMGGGLDLSALDKPRFHQMMRDALLCSESGPMPARKVEGIYMRILPASNRAINFMQFIEGLRHVALVHRLALNEVMERIVAVGGPRPMPP